MCSVQRQSKGLEDCAKCNGDVATCNKNDRVFFSGRHECDFVAKEKNCRRKLDRRGRNRDTRNSFHPLQQTFVSLDFGNKLTTHNSTSYVPQ